MSIPRKRLLWDENISWVTPNTKALRRQCTIAILSDWRAIECYRMDNFNKPADQPECITIINHAWISLLCLTRGQSSSEIRSSVNGTSAKAKR